mgnify:CR=1 FL=1
MIDLLKSILSAQLSATLAMLGNCIHGCPEQQWDTRIAKYPFWMVAYHTLCYVDVYLSPNDAAWQPHPTLHPRGRDELDRVARTLVHAANIREG